MSTQGDRLKEIRKQFGKISQINFAKSIGVSRTSVTNVEADTGNFEIKNYIKIVELYNVSLDWLILGIGNMFINSQEKDKSLLNQLKEEGFEPDSEGVLRKKK